MEVELRINITPTNIPPITKDLKDPLFLSSETDTLFILVANLKGYQKEKLKIDRDEDGTQIAVSGEKEAAGFLPRRFAFRATSQATKFRKVFSIPEGVVVDQINARFNEKESLLWVFMPKLVKGVSGIRIEEVKEEEIGRDGHTRTRTVPEKVPERGIPEKNEVEMKDVKKDLHKPEPESEVKEARTEVAERENHRKGEEEMKEGEKDVKPTVEVVGGLPRHEPEVKEATESDSPTKNEQEIEEGKKDIKAEEVRGRLPQLKPEEVGEAIFKDDEAAERENPRKDEQEMEEEKKDMEATDAAVGRLIQHEPQEVKQAADITMTSPEEEPTPNNEGKAPSKEETPGKEESDLEAKGRAAEEISEERQLGQDVTESTKVEADQVTQRGHVEEYGVNEENGKPETQPIQQEPKTEIQEASQEPSSDPTKPLEPDNLEEAQGMDQAETDPVVPHKEKFGLFSTCFFAGSAVLASIAVLVIYYIRSKRR